ncbi:hypothetical protein [Sulfurovum sp.]|uniref:hypothetical protein n=1 Tax=Sulfurovum sp. TaxID=1969726 RepID=UPI002867F963|nr:hypothetical protein [Sulfurovum sp.]
MKEKSVKKEKPKETEHKRKQGRPKKGEIVPAKKQTILQQQENMQSTEDMLSLVATKCDTSIKQNSKGNRHGWTGGKLHMSVIDDDIPVTAIYSAASVHDSSLALPLIQERSQKVNYMYDLQDAAYDSRIIRIYSEKDSHRPMIDINPKNSKVRKAQIALAKSEKKVLGSLLFYYYKKHMSSHFSKIAFLLQIKYVVQRENTSQDHI